MKKIIEDLLGKYLLLFPEEKERQEQFVTYLKTHQDDEVIDWNHFDGHVVAGGFLFAKEEKKFLVLYHKDLQMYLYPGGHMESSDKTPLDAARREVEEETGIFVFKEIEIHGNRLLPIDIDTHLIPFHERLKLPEHYHYEFRYLFVVDRIADVVYDEEELADFKWISMDELQEDIHYGNVARKICTFIK